MQENKSKLKEQLEKKRQELKEKNRKKREANEKLNFQPVLDLEKDREEE